MSPNLQMFAQDCSEEELRAVCKELFTPQRDHGIDVHGAARRGAEGVVSAQACLDKNRMICHSIVEEGPND